MCFIGFFEYGIWVIGVRRIGWPEKERVLLKGREFLFGFCKEFITGVWTTTNTVPYGSLFLNFSILYSQVLIELIRATVLVRVALPGRRFQFCLPLAFYGLP